ncbi:BnaC05g10720D [Brassica napus]|uniref:BnaC05g10720D protein n=1 Tax=Brassica napus TaxID=3708 RepID=A0A078HN55_BRANA|nr:BnaC05g10720D [Brassica napus]
MTFRIRNGDVEIHWPLIPFNQTLTTISSVELFRRCSSVVEARLLSFWEVRNGELMIDVNVNVSVLCFIFSFCSSVDPSF